MLTCNFPEFFFPYSKVSINGTDDISASQKLSGDAKIGARRVEQKQSASPRVGRVQTFIGNVAALAMWVLAAIPGASQVFYFSTELVRQRVDRQRGVKEVPEAQETKAVDAQAALVRQSEISNVQYISSACKLSISSLELAFRATDAEAIYGHLADFCERRRQINVQIPHAEFNAVEVADCQQMRALVQPPMKQDFLAACITGLEKHLQRPELGSEQKESIQYMLTMIASLKALPERESNTLIRYASPTSVRFFHSQA
jgi:hypothetical protein